MYDDVFIVACSFMHSRVTMRKTRVTRDFFVFVSMTITAGMALFRWGGGMKCWVFADLLSGDDSFDTSSLKYRCTEALWVFPVELKSE